MASISVFANQSPSFDGCFFSIACSPQTSYADITNELYSRLQIYETQYTVQIQARYNDIVNGRYESLFFSVRSEVQWRHYYHETFETRGIPILELFADFIPVYGTGPDLNLTPLDEPSSSEPNTTLNLFGGQDSNPYYYPSEQSIPIVSQDYGSRQPCSSGADGSRLSPVVENDNSEDDDQVEDDGDEEGPASYSDLPTGEEFSDVEDLHLTEVPFYANCDQPYISGRTDTHHPVSALCDISMFDYIGRPEPNLEVEGELAPGKKFRSKKQLILAVCDYCCKKNVEVKTETSNKKRIVMVCVQKPKCKWRLYGRCESWNNDWMISTNPTEHTCFRPVGEKGHDNLTASLIAEHVRDELKINLAKTVDDIGGLIRARYPRIQPTYNKLWRGRERAIEQLFGSWEGSYNKLPRLFEAMKRTTPGTKYTIVSWPTNDPNVRVFKMAAWAYGPCIEALKYARPVISIDASFLSGRYKGRLFVVCGYDPENHLIPVAFGLAEKEETLSWGWFMSWVRKEVIGDGTTKYCVISDRHRAIKAVFASTEYGWKAQGPRAVAIHRYCMQHVAENLWKEAGGSENRDLKIFFKRRLANKKNPRRFRVKWEELKATNRRAYRYLRNCGKIDETDEREVPKLYKWAQSFDKGHRWGIMTSNGSESLNNVFRVERRLPVSAIVEGTWYKCAKWMNKRTQEALQRISLGERWPEDIQKKLIKHDNKSRQMSSFTVRLDLGEFEVKVQGAYRDGAGYDYETFKVLIPPQMETTNDQLPYTGTKCDCQKPQLTGIPCAHVIAVCRETNYDANQFVDNRYSMWNQHKVWSEGIFHCYKDESEWPIYDGPTVVPDKSLINRGRRKIIRAEMAMDKMEGRKNRPQVKKIKYNTGKGSTSQQQQQQRQQQQQQQQLPPPPQEAYPMDTLQSGRRTSRPPSRSNSRRRNVAPRSLHVETNVQQTVQPGRRSLHVDPRSMSNRDDIGSVQPRRNSISADPRSLNPQSDSMRSESARFPTGQTSRASTTGEGRRKGFKATFRNIFTRK